MIRIDTRDAVAAILEKQRAVNPSTVGKAASNALNRAVTSVRTRISVEVRKEYRMKASAIKKNMVKVRRASPSKLSAEIHVNEGGLKLSDFPYRQTRRGLSVAVKRGKRRLIKRAFKQTTKKGFVSAFFRGKYENNKPVYSDAKQIRTVKTVSPWAAVVNEKVQAILSQRGADVFEQRFRHELKRLMGG